MEKSLDSVGQPGTAPGSAYPVGSILRYGPGRTALFCVTHIADYGPGEGIHYFGQQCMGGLYMARDVAVREASLEDLETWVEHAGWRFIPQHSELQSFGEAVDL